MNNIYYALFINADGSDEGMLTPNQLVGIFEREQLLSILRRELMLGHIHGEIPNDIDDADCPPDFFAVKVLSGLDTDNVWFRMVAPNVEDFDSDSGTFINLEGMSDDEREELIGRLVEQGADEEELRAMIAMAASDASDDSEDIDDTPAEEEPLTPLAAGYIGAAKELLRLAGISHFEYYRDDEE
jgi:hypothetical protein